jgi:phenylacetate-CoA ligase
MNPFLNPITGLPFLKNYIFNPGRLKRCNYNQIKKYRDKAFRKVVKYAYTVPVYNKKYKEAHVHPDDIKQVDDVVKLPFISKKELIDNVPNGIIPINYKKEKGFIATTGGSSGKPVSLYFDFNTLSNTLLFSAREGIIYNFNPRKIRFSAIGTYAGGRIDHVFNDAILQHTRFARKADYNLSLNAFDPLRNIVKKLNDFKPDIILSYPVTLQQLAYFKKKGYGNNIAPRFIFSGGYSLDGYTKKYVEEAFDCKIINLYQSVEGAGDIAFECFEGTWHVNHDFYHLESVDENMRLVKPGVRGHVIITRLFGKGTPIIRYSGMDDWVTLSSYYNCRCGLCTPIIKNGVEGRVSAQIFLPDGRVYPAASFESVSLVLNDLKTSKIIQFQTIQNKIDDIEILIVIDNDLRDVGPSVDFIFKKIEESYKKKCGHNVKITVKEVKEIKSPKNKPLPLVISKVKSETGFKIVEENLSKN